MIKFLTVMLVIQLFAFQFSFSQDNKENSFKPGGKVWGYVFGDYFYKAGGDSSGTTTQYSQYKKDFNSFDFRRVNVGYDHSFSPDFDFRFSLSFDGAEFTTDGKNSVYVRDAYLKWKNIFKYSDLTAGAQAPPGYSFTSDKVWSYRSVERTIMDFRGILGSRDIGLMLNGSFDKNKDFGYYLMVGNGTNGKIENNKYKRVYGQLVGNFAKKKIMVDIYSDFAPSASDKKYSFQAFVGYITDNFTFGLESYLQRNQSASLSQGISTFVHGVLVKNKLKGFFRYDFFDPKTYTVSRFRQHFVVAGADFMPIPTIHFIPNLWLNAYYGVNNADKKKSDVVGRITFVADFR